MGGSNIELDGDGEFPFRTVLLEFMREEFVPMVVIADGVPRKLADATGATYKTVRNWQNGVTLPAEPKTLARVLFGDNSLHHSAREKFYAAYDRQYDLRASRRAPRSLRGSGDVIRAPWADTLLWRFADRNRLFEPAMVMRFLNKIDADSGCTVSP